ncbi:glycerol-3-phosphate dehydrogenase [bacterium (Candidatus Blackallbacteria) CG17_big_fil_post_rev_8_21_14_2_50_48_46]|uniref:Glycerol-3-phosphate dehydrogenase n=1 Tax=bacterium (Candidatus Blackallbacteria) CG17_big_fil_post_rev_8_21_14_2_50_48_46 TaxID=2014261 RepID=A0A2M7FYN7_9BACT|nr:MAG: glycerol-3-phosphate dehydrogenase [bacterium (Candidatus Blackallbacteria) CG18_big_fil_WC_8_21_14_2_50_49_26]PIW14490.1 MAG: glycerol-3-phosphate dehydrogenase [bacterium (Candidatus Blackallbacteria) CG17_big_fil_post_rev_8_21_14_2_50_48_46]PIW47176.1 MAG: glycerol-3-phosphate dehydrogenase [bacterium (Candidatus Blackallbacteria) CG13_big_fil_rev_8_21_14_2_50_49_14]
MKRNLAQMATETYDLLIIGGGITGACIAWDAALRGLKTALVEKSDFSGATSSAPSKLVHGGLRYLKNLEFGLVRESLRERRYLEQIAPHQVDPLPFLLPAYRQSQNSPPILLAGMTLYELLSYDKRWLQDPDKQLPSFHPLSRKETLRRVPQLTPEGLISGLLYYDCLMHSPERLTLDFLQAASEAGADLANYAEVTGFEREGKSLTGVTLQDRIGGENLSLKSKVIVNASGPWADLLLGLMEEEPARHLLRSKGIHIITRAIAPLDQALTLTNEQGEHLFIIPWRGYSLIGTTDRQFEGHPDQFKVTSEDIDELIEKTNRMYPAAALTRTDVRYFYGGLRPIVEKETKVKVDSYKASRKHEVYDHEEEGIHGLISVIGGKYTTARHLAEQVVDKVYHQLKQPKAPCPTIQAQISGGKIERYQDFVSAQQSKWCLYRPELIAHLCRSYGARVDKVLEVGKTAPGLLDPLSPDLQEVGAEILYAVREEMAQTLADAVFRRTGLGTLGDPGTAALEKAADLMAQELGWDSEKRASELARVKARFVLPEAETAAQASA